VVAATEAPPPAPRVAVKAAYTATASSMAPLWLARERGLFSDQGLDVELVLVQPGPPVLAALQSGDAVFAIMGAAAAIPAALGGSDHVMIGSVHQWLNGSVFTEPGLTRPEELRGKRFSISRYGSTIDFGLRVALKQFGLNPEGDVLILQTGGMPEALAALQAGAVDGTSLAPPQSFEARRLGYYEMLNLDLQKIPYAGTALVTTRGYLGSHADVLEQAARALAAAIQLYDADRPAAYAVLGKYGRIEDPAVVQDAYETNVGQFSRDLVVKPEAVQAVFDQVAADLPQATTARPEEVVDPTITNRLRDSGYLRQLGQ
jgi:NitT/TauT family transport system substrate-binding protein